MSETGVWQEQLSRDVWLVKLQGRLDQDLSARLQECLVDLLENGRKRLIVDLGAVNYINSGGLRCLVSAWRKARKQNGDVILIGLNARLQEIFSIIGFDHVFKIFDTREMAEGAFETA